MSCLLVLNAAAWIAASPAHDGQPIGERAEASVTAQICSFGSDSAPSRANGGRGHFLCLSCASNCHDAPNDIFAWSLRSTLPSRDRTARRSANGDAGRRNLDLTGFASSWSSRAPPFFS
jgi:hypothetical protein